MAKLAQLVRAWDAGGRAQLVPAFRDQAAVSFSSPADRGTLDIANCSYASNVFTFRVRWDNTANSTGGRFLLARLAGVNGLMPTIRVERSNFGITLNNTWRFVYSYDGVTWLQMANRSSDATYYIASHSAPFAADQVYVALFPPWQTGRTLPFIQSLEGTGYIGETPSTSGYVFQTRSATVNEAGAVVSSTPLYAFKIGVPGMAPDGGVKRNMVLISGVHASEDIGNYALKGAVEFLVSEDPQAQTIRQWFNVYVYPVVASAGRKGGGTRGDYQSGYMTTDINRQWNGSTFETLTKHKAAILADTGGAAAVFIDFHGTVAQSYNYDFYETGNNVAAWTNAIRTYIPGLTQLAQDDNGTSSEWAQAALSPAFSIISEHAIGYSNVLQATVETNGAAHMRAVALLASSGYFGIGAAPLGGNASAAATASGTLTHVVPFVPALVTNWPDALRPASVDWGLFVPKMVGRSAFDGSAQTTTLGPPRWFFTIDTGPLRRDELPQWEALSDLLQDGNQRLRTWDWRREAPLGVATGTPLVRVAGTGASLQTKGWTSNVAGILLAGTYFSVNGELKRLSADASSNASGHATLYFKPPLRKTAVVDTPLVLAKPTAVFMLTDDRVSFAQQGARFPGRSLTFMEDLAYS